MLIQALEKNDESASYRAIQKQLDDSFEVTTTGEKIILHSKYQGLSLTFDAKDMLNKIEITAHTKSYQLYIEEHDWRDEKPMYQNVVLQQWGEPTARMPYPSTMIAQEQWFYNKENYWISLKFKHDQLESIAFLSSDLIPDGIKKKHVPIRICKSKD
jgi:hypothetical protein